MNETHAKEKAVVTVDPKVKAFRALVESMRARIAAVLPKHITVERALRVYNNAMTRNNKLLDCTQESLYTAFITASEFGLEPNTPLGQCYMIPYGQQATFQMGYQGIIDLAYRSGKVSLIFAEPVHDNDVFALKQGLHRDLIHEPLLVGERGKVIGYYAVVQIIGFEPQFAFMSLPEIYAHAKRYSKAYQAHLAGKYSDTPWKEDPGTLGFDSMAKKTVMIQACKTAPKSIDDKGQFAKALYADDDITLKQPATTASAVIDLPPVSLDDLTTQLEAEAQEPEPESQPSPKKTKSKKAAAKTQDQPLSPTGMLAKIVRTYRLDSETFDTLVASAVNIAGFPGTDDTATWDVAAVRAFETLVSGKYTAMEDEGD